MADYGGKITKPMTQIPTSSKAGSQTAIATKRGAAFRRLNRYATSGEPADSAKAIVQNVVTIGPVQGWGSCQLSIIHPATSSRKSAIRRSNAAPAIRNARNIRQKA